MPKRSRSKQWIIEQCLILQHEMNPELNPSVEGFEALWISRGMDVTEGWLLLLHDLKKLKAGEPSRRVLTALTGK